MTIVIGHFHLTIVILVDVIDCVTNVLQHFPANHQQGLWRVQNIAHARVTIEMGTRLSGFGMGLRTTVYTSY